jgi:3-deoxy-7-phosphoheptulonate synthase
MIIQLKEELTKEKAHELSALCEAIFFQQNNSFILVTSSKQKKLLQEVEPFAERTIVTESDIQLASKLFQQEKRKIKIDDIEIGGNTHNTLVITGPCSVESETQIEASALLCQKLGVKILRAGAFKPRTSPYSFQGLGLEGLKLLAKMRSTYGLKIITEVKDFSHVHEVIDYADVVQIGAKAMYDQSILKACALTQKPVLLKRGFGTTLQEFVQAAEFILCGGNPNVILCERGIRTFETKTRFTLDLCGVSWLKQHTNLPIVIDPSHAMGFAYGVADLTRAALAMGVDGVLIETHPNPAIAKSDAEQQLNFEQFSTLYYSLHSVANAVGYKII